MQERYAVVRATVIEYTLPVAIPRNTSTPYGNSDESDGGPPSPKMTDATQLKIDKSLQIFIETLPFLEPLHYGLKLQVPNQSSASCICSLAKGLTPWERRLGIVDNYLLCGMNPFHGHSLIQHCELKSNEYHTATAFYLKTLFGASRKNGMPIDRGFKQAAVHQGKSVDDQSRKTADANKQVGRYFQSVNSQESDHVNKVNEDVDNKARDLVGDLVICGDLEKNDASTSIEQE
jgi:hypothetical protein